MGITFPKIKNGSHWIKVIGLILGLIILVAAQSLLSATHWLQLDEFTFQPLSDISCTLIPICTPRYPGYFGIALVILLIALVLLILTLRRSALKVTHDVDWSFTQAKAKPYSRRRLALSIFLGQVAALLTWWMVVSAVNVEDHYPDPRLWFAAILLWAIAFFSLDRSRSPHPSVLTRRELSKLVGYILLLFLLGFVYHLPVLQSWESRAGLIAITALIVLGLWQFRRISGVVVVFTLIAVAGLAAYTYNIDSWQYSFIGDEFVYYQNPQLYVQNPEQVNILDSRGVYEAHPVLATVIQAATIVLYGGDVYSWRINGMLLILMSAPAIYLLVRQLKSSNAGLLAAILFVSAHHLIGFAHAGYYAMQIFPGAISMLALAVLALQRQSRLAIFLCGVAASFTFYTYTLAIPLIPLPLLLIGLWAIWPSRVVPLATRIAKAIPFALIFVIAVLVTCAPRLLNTRWFTDAASNTVLSHTEIPGMTNPLLQQILPNIAYTLGATLYFNLNSHYVSGAHLDPLSDILLILGVAGLIATLLRKRVALWLLISFLLLVVVIGGSVPYPYPSHARTFTLVMFYAVFGALGASYLWDALVEAGVRISPTLLRLAAAVVVVVIVSLNLYQFFVLAEKGFTQTTIAMIVRQYQVNPPDMTFYYIDAVPNDDNMFMVLDALHLDSSRIKPILSSWPMIALSEIRRDAKPPYQIVMGKGWGNASYWLSAAKLVWSGWKIEDVGDLSQTVFFNTITVLHPDIEAPCTLEPHSKQNAICNPFL